MRKENNAGRHAGKTLNEKLSTRKEAMRELNTTKEGGSR